MHKTRRSRLFMPWFSLSKEGKWPLIFSCRKLGRRNETTLRRCFDIDPAVFLAVHRNDAEGLFHLFHETQVEENR